MTLIPILIAHLLVSFWLMKGSVFYLKAPSGQEMNEVHDEAPSLKPAPSDGRKIVYLPETHTDFVFIMPSPWAVAYLVFGVVFILFTHFRFLSAR